MSGDYSRWSFDPARNFAEVFKQQGRVDLDSDWNEFVEIVNRRWRAETIDIIGRAVVPDPKHEAFKITPTELGKFTIGVGRMYVDGLLAECHGWIPEFEVNELFRKSGLEKTIKYGVARGEVDVALVSPFKQPNWELDKTTEYDAALGEVNSALAVPFYDQPFYPNPKPDPKESRAGQTDLIYLDVWQREVTAVEVPEIREKALGGPDTTTRMQTVWQVKVLPNVRTVVCGSQISDWNTLTAPPAGRLTTSAVTPPASPDPCSLSPAGGYQGLENRLYRVEVHVGGVVGGDDPGKRAKFKWSRDNGSVVSVVDSISGDPGTASSVVLKSLGRDRVLRFKSGDWVEILDDHTEFGASDFVRGNFVGKAGWLAKIIDPPDEASRTIKVSPGIPGNLFATEPEALQKRHTRVRRWDQRNTGAGSKVDDATGLIDVTAGPIDIEDGIQVSFSASPTGGQLRVGDYWVFAARAAARTPEDSIERLHKAPPRGILHHYARVAIVTWVAGDQQPDPEDCRKFWPPECGACSADCTVTVGDGVNSHGEFTDIREAIKSLGTAGGVVCVGRGVFKVSGRILLGPRQKNVTIRGMGWATKLIFEPADSSEPKVLFDIADTSHVVLESFFAAAKRAESLVRITSSNFCAVCDTALVNLDIFPDSLDGFFNVSTGLPPGNGRAIELVDSCTDCVIERNVLVAAKGIVSAEESQPPGTGSSIGRVWGRIRDKQGAVIPNAKVNLKNQATNTSFSATTNAEGIFEAQFMPVGSYTLFVNDVPLEQTVTVEADRVAKVELTHDRASETAGPIATMPAPPAASKPSDVRHLVIRSNHIFARQASIFLVKTEGCDILENRLFGLRDVDRLKEALEDSLKGADDLQNVLLMLLTDPAAGLAIKNQAAGVVLLSGVRVTIAGNAITGLGGLLAGFLAATRIEDNQIVAGIGQLVLNGLALRLSGNFIAGFLAGSVQSGITLDFVSESNFWAGLNGLLSIDLKTLLKMVGDSLDGGLSDALKDAEFRVPTDFATTVRKAARPFPSSAISAVVKIHHDVFITFRTAIGAKLLASGDIALTDNCFEGCAQAGIRWVGFSSPKLLSPLHLIENNTFKVQGAGVRCRCADGVFRGNTVQCREVAFDLWCLSGMVQDNTINGRSTAENNNENGLIILRGFPDPVFRMVGNRLKGGKGHGLLIASSLGDLVVEDNSIQGMPQNGITTSDNTLVLQSVRISGNDISNCQGRGAGDQNGMQGAIILPEVAKNLLVHGNRLTGNQGIGMYLNGAQWGVIRDLRLLVQDNSVDGDGTHQLIRASGYAVQFTGNQCIERSGLSGVFPLVELWGQWIVANGNTVLHNQTMNRQSLALHGMSLSIGAAIATSNILNGAPQIYLFAKQIPDPNVELP